MLKKMSKKSGLLLCVLVVMVVLSACTQSGGNKDNSAVSSLDREDSGTLKVAYFNEQAFYMQYGNAFQAMFPNIELEVVSTESVFNAEDPVAEMKRLMQEQQPDVIYLSEEEYSVMAKEGLLYDLDAVVKQDEYDLESFVPSVIELLKAHGGGKLYGLSPSFSSQALYYNKDLFDKHGIPYPQDGMSWEEVMQLASRFPVKKDGDDALNGLFQSTQATNSFELIRMIGEAKGLLYADADSKTVSIETAEWKSIIQSVVDGYESGSISMPSENNGGNGGLVMRGMGGRTTFRMGPDSMRFMTGQAAMTIDGPMVMNMLGMEKGMGLTTKAQAAAPAGKGENVQNPIKDINWDVVTLPVDPSQPDVSGMLSLDSVFSINGASQSLSAAWEFVKYVSGEQLAKTNSMSSPALSARADYKIERDGKNVDAFYALGVNQQSLLQELPEDFEASFAKLASEQVKKIVEGTLTVDEALKAIQAQGQDLLTQAIVDAEQQ